MGLLQALSQEAAFINAEVVPWVLRLVMVGLGLSLTLADFRRVIVFPKAAAIGLIGQLVGMPLTAFVLALIFNPPPFIAVGLVILAACPSGITSNAYSFAARADVPLCVTLSAVTSVITVFSIPFLINLALRVFGDEGQLGALPVLPMLIGLVAVVREHWKAVRVSEHQAILKREMLERGFTADEIARVIEAAPSAEASKASKDCKRAGCH